MRVNNYNERHSAQDFQTLVETLQTRSSKSQERYGKQRETKRVLFSLPREDESQVNEQNSILAESDVMRNDYSSSLKKIHTSLNGKKRKIF
jgi:hypothetical protein